MGSKMITTSFLRALESRSRRPSLSPLSSPKLGAKLYFLPGPRIEAQEFIPIFQRWVAEDVLQGEQMIDVVRYRHVKDGPWVMMVGLGSHYAIDGADGRPGLRYSRRRRASGSPGERLRSLLATSLAAARRLTDETALLFATDELELSIEDRLLAPNTKETFERVEDELRPFSLLLFEGAEIEPINATSPKNPFRVRVRAAKRRTIEELEERLLAMRARALLMS